MALVLSSKMSLSHPREFKSEKVVIVKENIRSLSDISFNVHTLIVYGLIFAEGNISIKANRVFGTNNISGKFVEIEAVVNSFPVIDADAEKLIKEIIESQGT